MSFNRKTAEGELIYTSLTGKALRNDNVFVTSECLPIAQVIPGYPCSSKYEKAIISEGKIVNIVSETYGHLDNLDFFMPVEMSLLDADISFTKRSVNKNNSSFAVDYILNDEKYVVKVKAGKETSNDDKIVPMMRFVNSYDGTSKTIGYFGMFREVCMNGLTIGKKQIGFSIKHSSKINTVILPNIEQTIASFFENDYYSLQKKFTVLAETAITNVPEFVSMACEATKLMTYAKSEKNPEPGLNAQIVIDSINREATMLGTNPNLWLGYNALNEILYSKFNKTFDMARTLDNKVFDFCLELAN